VLILFAITVYFAPNFLGHSDNYIPANPLTTPAHIVPEWYFWPFYAILRAFTVDFILAAKLWGVLAMFASILLLFFLPWLDNSAVRSGSYRPMFKRFFWILVADVIVLGWAGGRAATPVVIAVSQLATAYYFAHFLIILPLISKFERPLALPDSISSSALHGEAREAAPAGIARRSPTTATPAE
jgi:ubiquinol-cytochrome c reductase cytochrome b subunit